MRLKVIRLIYFFIVLLIVLRLGYWQIIKADDLAARGEDQRVQTKQLSGFRGDILFSDRAVLATSQPSYLLFTQPQQVKQAKKLSDTDLSSYYKGYIKDIAKVLNDEKIKDKNLSEDDQKKSQADLEDSLFKRININLGWVSLGEKVDEETKRKLEDLNLPFLGFDLAPARLYPEGSSSAHLLGFTGSNVYGDQTGYFGLEGFYDGELKGKKGLQVEEKDAMGIPILIGKFVSKEPKNGKTLVLNIDRAVQHIVEEKLKLGMQKYGAKGGSVVIMDPQTGGILAMASYPSYDPAKPSDYPKENYRNPITADGYEPGSTFKVLVMAAAINEQVVKEDTRCDICSGPVEVGGYSIKTWNNQYQPNLTMTDTIIHSDNTGMVFVSRKLGLQKIYDYIKKFGVGDTTGIDLQDEQSPDLRNIKDWHEIDQATAAFGQGISTTAIQIVRAVGSLANAGKLMEPHVVKEIKDGNNNFEVAPRVVAQPISADSANIVTQMMIRAVNEGESQSYKKSYGLQNYLIAGKTGTAQIPVAGHYDANKTIASFVGFAPADKPKFVMLVRYDQPTSSIYGADTAAPTFFDIAKQLFLYYGIAPNSE